MGGSTLLTHSLLLAYAVTGRLVTHPDTTLAVARENLRRTQQSGHCDAPGRAMRVPAW